MLEALPVPLGRALGDEMGSAMGDLHRDHGVAVRLGVGVAGIEGAGRVGKVRLADDSVVEADLVVVGIGVTPNTGWLEVGAGPGRRGGVRRHDPRRRASWPPATWRSLAEPPVRRADARVEHWDNTIAMGEHAARRLLDDLADGAAPPGEPYDPVPWFWSDQYDRKIQLAGRSSDADEVRVVDGSLEERRFVALYRRGDRLVGALAMNRPACW